MFNIGWPEFLLIGVVVLVVFGPSKLTDLAKTLPDIANSLGRTVKSFKKGLKEGLGDEGKKKAETKSEED